MSKVRKKEQEKGMLGRFGRMSIGSCKRENKKKIANEFS